MMDFNITDEELNALKNYKEKNYEAINQMLVSNAETDIALLSSEVENKVVSISYDRESVIEYLRNIKLIYKLMLKYHYGRKNKISKKIYRGTNLSEIERIKRELFIDRMLSATENEDEAINTYSAIWNRPVCINISLDENIPCIVVKDLIKEKKYKNEILIAPFTRVKYITEDKEKKIDKNSKTSKVYNIELEKQTLDELTERERNGLYQYILENAYSIRRKIVECIDLEKENVINFENIRKLEQLLSKYENEIEEKEASKDYSDIEREIDYDDIERINKELSELKNTSTELSEVRKENINFINMWKRNIAVYMIAECREIEKLFEDTENEQENSESVDTKNFALDNEKVEEPELKENNTNEELEKQEEKTIIDENSNKNNESTNGAETKIQETKIVEIIKEISNNKKGNLDNDETEIRVKNECKENIEAGEKLLANIKDLITKQQNHAKIAGNTGAVYSALNNAFAMRKVGETLLSLLNNIFSKFEEICETEDAEIKKDKLENMSKVNIQISTLINYLNNPKIATRNSKATRFDEMAIIEENELKRGIAERIRSIRGEAELKKLKDDLEIIDNKGTFSRFLGIFTGQNKLDEFMIEQIEIRQSAIRKTLSRKLSLAYNYSIHELMAEIRMFIEENSDDELVQKDVSDLNELSEELKRNFVILETKVQSIVDEKEGKHLPLENRKLSKREIIEIETYRFLNKYGYDVQKIEKEEPKYQDTMANEISRIVEYINSSNII